MKWIVSKTNTPNHLQTITEAITKASDYDEIHIYTGHYKEKLIINKEIKIIGFGTVCIYYDCDFMDHVISIKETVKLENLIIQSQLSNILYIYTSMDVEIKNCKLISETQNCINIYNSGNFIIKKCHIEAKKNGIDYNNILNVFNHSGKIEKCNIYSHNYAIKLVNYSKLYIIDTLLDTSNKCVLLNENTYLTLENITIKNLNKNFIEYKNNSCPKYNLLIQNDIIFKN
tara:strand:+ start:5275 stop:5961 length:687 start_codon:yes stop_codon:yes gene_type:complete